MLCCAVLYESDSTHTPVLGSTCYLRICVLSTVVGASHYLQIENIITQVNTHSHVETQLTCAHTFNSASNSA